MEGEATMLIEGGQVRHEALSAERISLQELTTAAHRQGFRTLDEVEYARLEPGGALTFVGKDPSPSTRRSRELLMEIRLLRQEVAALREAKS